MKVKIWIALKSFDSKELSKPLVSKDSPLNEEAPAANRLNKFQAIRGPNQLQNEFPNGVETEIKNSNLVSISLPQTKKNFTVLRSPHIDKKSREQFELKIYKKLIIISCEIYQMREKLFNLKFHGIPGVQMKVIFKTKTRLN